MQFRGTAAVTAPNWLGWSAPLPATAHGQSLPAHLPPTPPAGPPARPPPPSPSPTATGAPAFRCPPASLAARRSASTLAARQPGLLPRPLQPFTEHTVTGAAASRGGLRTVVERGYACTLEELELGLSAVAAPVRSHEGRVVAAISVSGPVYRLTPQRLPALGERAAAAAADLSRRMGYGF